METIRVVVNGASGKMGREIIKALCCEPGIEVVGAAEKAVSSEFYLPLPDCCETAVPFSSNLDYILTSCHPDVMVDFTIAQATMPAVRLATAHGIHLVIGTTGLNAGDLTEIDQLSKAHKVGAVVASNFALSAVIMMHLARVVAREFDVFEFLHLCHTF